MWNVSDYVLMLGMLTELPRGQEGGIIIIIIIIILIMAIIFAAFVISQGLLSNVIFKP